MSDEILDYFRNFSNFTDVDDVLAGLAQSFKYIALGLLVAVVIAGIFYVIASYGLYKILKKNKEQHAWLAFIPFARDYMLAKLGYEVYEKTQYDYLKYVVLVLSILFTFVISKDSMGNLYNIVKLGILVIKTGAVYNILKKNYPDDYVFKLILFIVFKEFIFLFIHGSIKPANELKEVKTKEPEKKENEEVIVEKVEEHKTTTKSSSFCRHCGESLNKGDKFCANCGKEVK